MKWIVFVFICAVSLGFVRRSRGGWDSYLVWLVLCLLTGFGFLFI